MGNGCKNVTEYAQSLLLFHSFRYYLVVLHPIPVISAWFLIILMMILKQHCMKISYTSIAVQWFDILQKRHMIPAQ